MLQVARCYSHAAKMRPVLDENGDPARGSDGRPLKELEPGSPTRYATATDGWLGIWWEDVEDEAAFELVAARCGLAIVREI
jgi:hypothetical protein